MKRLIVLAIVGVLVAVALGMSRADSFNPGAYPLIYRSSATPQASPTAGSGVIYAPTSGGLSGQVSAWGGCEFFNSGATAEWFTIYDSATVAGQTPANTLCITQCQANSTCNCNATTAPIGPQVNAGLVAKNGLSWGDSKTVPGPTASPDLQGWAICNYIVR